MVGKFRIITKQGLEGDYPYGIRDDGGFKIFFTRPSRYTDQEKRFEEEAQEMWDIAEITLKALNQTP